MFAGMDEMTKATDKPAAPLTLGQDPREDEVTDRNPGVYLASLDTWVPIAQLEREIRHLEEGLTDMLSFQFDLAAETRPAGSQAIGLLYRQIRVLYNGYCSVLDELRRHRSEHDADET